jgi:hypothetical protein
MLGNGAGGFTYYASLPTGTDPNSIAVGDFNGDGKQDLAVANYFGNDVTVRRERQPYPHTSACR